MFSRNALNPVKITNTLLAILIALVATSLGLDIQARHDAETKTAKDFAVYKAALHGSSKRTTSDDADSKSAIHQTVVRLDAIAREARLHALLAAGDSAGLLKEITGAYPAEAGTTDLAEQVPQ